LYDTYDFQNNYINLILLSWVWTIFFK